MCWNVLKKSIVNMYSPKSKNAKVKITRIYEYEKPLVICDTNVWYEIANEKFNKPDKVLLIPTSFSLEELATSKLMAHHTKYFQHVVKSIYDNCGPIIPFNPFEFVLNSLDSEYKINDDQTVSLLNGFSELLSRKIDDEEIDEELKGKIIKDCEDSRKPTFDFANFGNDEINIVRKNINIGIGKKEHVKEDSTEINKQMLMAMFNACAKLKNYTINWNNFDWNQIELFMVVTEIYFKKLETTKDMKISSNDVVDWFNLLYVTPNDKYLTFDDKWRNYILGDDRIKHYLYL
jgi:hypothetical protein